jgi:hypothetical protein
MANKFLILFARSLRSTLSRSPSVILIERAKRRVPPIIKIIPIEIIVSFPSARKCSRNWNKCTLGSCQGLGRSVKFGSSLDLWHGGKGSRDRSRDKDAEITPIHLFPLDILDQELTISHFYQAWQLETKGRWTRARLARFERATCGFEGPRSGNLTGFS